jgi:hypothetical protein
MISQRGIAMQPRRDPWLITRLFDLAFTRFIALSLIRIVYFVLMVAGLVLLALLTYYLFQIGERIAAVLLLVLSPVAYLVYLLVVRLVCETLIVVFAMAEDLGELREAMRQQADKGRA